MTNEEAREQIKNLRAHCSNMLRHTFTDGEDIWGKDLEALDLAIKALAQEPCEDAISRQAVMNAFCDGCELFKTGEQTCHSKCEEYHFLATLPSVRPKEKVGHNCNEQWADCDQFVCSECGIELQDWQRYEHDEDDGEIMYYEYVFNYCPNCGARMI